MPSDPYLSARDLLLALAPARVWSLVITIFGDMSQNEGQWLSGPTLTRLLGEMQVKPDALRVALHRLRSDGWIVSEKRGRTARHTLSDKGRKESRAASSLIYATSDQANTDWYVALMPEGGCNAPNPAHFLPLAPRVFLCAGHTRTPDNTLILSPHDGAAWVEHSLAPKPLTQDYAALFTALERVTTDLGNRPDLDPTQTAVIRALVVHTWRRLVLKHPDLPNILFTPAWKGHACRALVTDLLSQLPRPSLT